MSRPVWSLAPWLRAVALAGALAAGAVGAAGAPQQVAAPEAVHEHIVQRGDTLVGIGRRFLSQPLRWPELARVNALANPNRLKPGTPLRIPLRLMSTEAVPATLVSVTGSTTGAVSEPLQAGQAIKEGGEIRTGDDGHATVRLVDGTVLRLRPGSRLQVSESRQVRQTDAVRSGARLEQGRVEVEAAPARAGRPGFRIETPQGVLGVRGTEFRVSSQGEPGQQAVTRGEVLGGVVAFRGDPASPAEPVSAGFGTSIDQTGSVAPPVRLLPPPDTATLPSLQEQVLVRFALAPVAGAAAYRGQVATDAAFDRVLGDVASPTPEIRFADLADGDYVLRLRAIDAQGLEGRDADHRFRLKARPEAPILQTPAPRAVLSGGRAEFAWAANAEAKRYRFQLARTPDFQSPVRAFDALTDLALAIEGLEPGTYHWRIRSLRGDGDAGPWGAARSFELRAVPVPPQSKQVGSSSLAFAWEGLPGQRFDFEVARDAAFQQRVFGRQLDRPEIEVPLPGSGRFFVRLRAIDPDGFVGPYTAPQHVDLPNCLRDSAGGCVRAGDQTLNLAP